MENRPTEDAAKSLKYDALVNGNRPNPSKYETECSILAKNSYKCLEDNLGDNTKCQDAFAVYRRCRKEESDRLIEERRKRGVNFFG